jgi:hypothetical protein
MLRNATGRMPRHSTDIAADSFEWPPADEVLNGQRIEVSPQPLEDVSSAHEGERSPSPEPPAKVGAPDMSSPPVRHSPYASHVAAVPTVLPPGHVESPSASRTRARPTWVRAHRAHAILVALVVVVVAGAITIVRTVRLPPVLLATDTVATHPQMPAPETARPTGLPATPSKAVVAPLAPVVRTPTAPTSLGRSRDARPTSGRLIIRTNPAGAAITIDGRSYGVTPRTVTNLPSGDYRIVLSLGGVEVVHSVSLNRGETVSVVAPLRADSGGAGWIAISSPFVVDVFEDGSLVGTSRSPRIMLNAGSHALELVNDETGFRQSGRFEIRPGRVEQIGVDVPRSLVHVNAIPWAEVWIDGQPVGQTPLGNLPIPIGHHEIVFRHPSLGERTISTLVKAGIPSRVTANLRAPLAAAQ